MGRAEGHRIGAGTIYHLAMERGWEPDAAMVLDGTAPAEPVHPAAGLLARLEIQEPQPTAEQPQEPAFDLQIPEGILAEMVEYMVSTARRPQPLLSLGAGLCALGALSFGDKVGQKPETRRPRPSPRQITEAEEALLWLRWLEVEDAQLVWARVNRASWKELCWQFGISRTTADRRWQYGLAVIVWRLNGREPHLRRGQKFVIAKAQ